MVSILFCHIQIYLDNLISWLLSINYYIPWPAQRWDAFILLSSVMYLVSSFALEYLHQWVTGAVTLEELRKSKLCRAFLAVAIRPRRPCCSILERAWKMGLSNEIPANIGRFGAACVPLKVGSLGLGLGLGVRDRPFTVTTWQWARVRHRTNWLHWGVVRSPAQTNPELKGVDVQEGQSNLKYERLKMKILTSL